MDKVDLIDLCSIQGTVDWVAVRGAGFEGAYIKSSQYTSTADHRFGQYAEDASRAGLAVGAYHFAYCGSDPVAQAEYFFRQADKVGQLAGDMPPALDLEFAKNIPPKDIVSWGERFMARARELWYGTNSVRLPILYTYPYFAKSLQPYLKDSKLTEYPLWIANYKSDAAGKLVGWYPTDTDKPMATDGWDNPTIWQYSGNNGLRVPGIAVDCDRDLFLGSRGAWEEFLGQVTPALSVPTPEPVAVKTIDNFSCVVRES